MAKKSRRNRTDCARGCVSYCKLPEGAYFAFCGPIAEARRQRGEPISGYKKVGEPKVVDGKSFSGGSIEMLLKKRGWGRKSAMYRPVRGCPCVRKLGRDWAVRYAEAVAKAKGVRQQKVQAA